MAHAEVTLPGSTSSVPAARRFVESIVTAWGHPDLGWCAALIVSELAGNAALHARTPFTVSVDLGDGEGATVRVEVRDGSRRLPQQRTYGAEATTGRGLRLVQDIAASWGVIDREGGKTVWVILDDSSAATHPEDAGDAAVDELLSTFGDTPAPSGSATVSASVLRVAA